jgi:N-methylhydantoinase A
MDTGTDRDRADRDGEGKSSPGTYRVGFDVGGTFTDFVLQSPSGALRTAKRLTTHPDPSEACLAGLDELMAQTDTGWTGLGHAVHGTTLGSNVVIERKGRRVALLTTRGFRDVLIIGREKRYQVYDLQIEKPAPLIPRRHIVEVTERIRSDGSVHVPLHDDDARRQIRALQAAGVTSLAVCLLHAYANPAHERRVADLVAEEAPGMTVSLSHEISPMFREYERTSTTVVNAYVMSAVRLYLRTLREEMTRRGYRGRLFVMQSSGGIATAEAMERYPVRMIESGPTAGTLMAAAYGEWSGQRDLIAFDMGGTTAKLALIEQGKPLTTSLFELHRVGLQPGSGIPMSIHAIDLVEIGAGGGSIARVEFGTVRVGPESAASRPGPACYALGGEAPTVTDADLILGYLNPDRFADGSMRLDRAAAWRAIEETIASPLALSVPAAAWGIHRVVNSNMELATRVVSIERGRDPRDLTLVAFGGSGPVHGCRLAQSLRIPRVMLPAAAGVTAALGLLAAEVRFDVARTYVAGMGDVALDHVNAMYREMQAQAEEVLRHSAHSGPITVLRSADARYVGQGYELSVGLPPGDLGPEDMARVRADFDRAYAARYGYGSPAEPVEIVNWRLSAIGASRRLELPRYRRGGSLDAALVGRRAAYFPEHGGYVETPVYDRYRLFAGVELHGPAIIEERESTTVLPPGAGGRVDELGSLVVEVSAWTP